MPRPDQVVNRRPYPVNNILMNISGREKKWMGIDKVNELIVWKVKSQYNPRGNWQSKKFFMESVSQNIFLFKNIRNAVVSSARAEARDLTYTRNPRHHQDYPLGIYQLCLLTSQVCTVSVVILFNRVSNSNKYPGMLDMCIMCMNGSGSGNNRRRGRGEIPCMYIGQSGETESVPPRSSREYTERRFHQVMSPVCCWAEHCVLSIFVVFIDQCRHHDWDTSARKNQHPARFSLAQIGT